METMETKVNTTNETESAAHQTGMMDIINIVLTCVFLCVMNTGVIFIMGQDKEADGR
mgnify:CR=1 FL=1